MKKYSKHDLNLIRELVLDETPVGKSSISDLRRVNENELSRQLYLLEMIMSSSYLRKLMDRSIDFHLYLAHYARIKMVASLLPEAKIILDLGGANGSIYDMGYPYSFDRITVVDLPPEERDDMYRGIDVKPIKTPNGIIDVHFGDMSDLSFAADNSVDMVWSGESIEHISHDAGKKMLQEAFRVLKAGGYLCLDTPNRLITEIHTAPVGGGFIHPEHKLEYYPADLQRMLRDAGFIIEESRGICEMKNSYSTKQFDYTDFVLGNPLPYEVDKAYMQFYRCRKPYNNMSLSRLRQAIRPRTRVRQLLGH